MTSAKITYAGHSAVFVQLAGIHLAVDPWLQGNPLCPSELQSPSKLDLIVLTHGHSDHAGDAVRVAKATGASIAATYELAMIMVAEGISSDKVIPMNKGGSVDFKGVAITLTNAFHSSSFDGNHGTVYAGEACGAIIAAGETVLYHAGDTELFGDMRILGERHQPTVAMLPIGDRFTMGPADAAQAAEWLRCGLAIPIHYKTFDLLSGTYEEFGRECDRRGVPHRELQPGESLAV